MKTIFEINDSMRVMDNGQLVYILSESEKMKQEQHKYDAMGLSELSVFDILDKLTPGRKKLACAAIELYKRLKEGGIEKATVRCSVDIFNVMHPILCDIDTEECWVILVNQVNKIIRKIRISCGGLSETSVDVRVIMKQAILYNAAGFALVHNHPSGSPRPSRQDDQLTECVYKASKTMNISLLDHVIIGGNKYYSYADEGKI